MCLNDRMASYYTVMSPEEKMSIQDTINTYKKSLQEDSTDYDNPKGNESLSNVERQALAKDIVLTLKNRNWKVDKINTGTAIKLRGMLNKWIEHRLTLNKVKNLPYSQPQPSSNNPSFWGSLFSFGGPAPAPKGLTRASSGKLTPAGNSERKAATMLQLIEEEAAHAECKRERESLRKQLDEMIARKNNNKSMNIENISLTMENNAVNPVVTNQSLTPWQQKMKKLQGKGQGGATKRRRTYLTKRNRNKRNRTKRN